MEKKKKKGRARLKNTWMFHAMLAIPCLFLFIYSFLPIPAGIMMAFQNFQPGKGFFGSDFVELKNFRKLLLLPDTMPALRNTLIIAICKIVGNLAVAVTFALLLNEVRGKAFKRTVQTITYLPYFLSWVVLAGIMIRFLSPGSAATNPGLLNTVLVNLGVLKEPVYF
ncbi:MAG: sugar ABC transporter permease, partial [Lachnospiraceae bacterium]|nr:sugar ABC transporter permease [Lachnospiraceae bacterium]